MRKIRATPVSGSALTLDYVVKPLNELDEEKTDTMLQDLNILRSITNNSYLLTHNRILSREDTRRLMEQ